MAKIKIFLEEGETPDSAKDQIHKALKMQDPENQHSEEFEDEVIEALVQDSFKEHLHTINAILKDVEAILKSGA